MKMILLDSLNPNRFSENKKRLEICSGLWDIEEITNKTTIP